MKIPSEVQALRELLLTQARQIEELRERLELLERKNAELRSRLGQTSRNSHRPPSSEAITRRLRVLRCRSNAGFASVSSRTRRSAPGGRAGRSLTSLQCACGSPSIASPRSVTMGRSI
ncbi:MAG: DUF6444 domain-containing protein [Proteobacteria bacterium]|nr:DUF6444 domain-containing protein [Pseudomonadota bacterium]